jgi:hypothetical protein
LIVVHKLLKYLSKTFELPVDNKRLTPVVLTDSKGKYLERYCQNPLENSIKWWAKPGRNSTEGLELLKENLKYKIEVYIYMQVCVLVALYYMKKVSNICIISRY